MKLTLGDNIRRLRREKDLTQEQLAEALGVSFQAVSRWENGTTYPDIELLPAIARFFDASVDKLIGVPEEEKERQVEELVREFQKAEYAKPYDAKKLCSILSELRRDYIDCKQVWYVWDGPNGEALRIPEVLQELRLLAEEMLKKYPDDNGGCYAVILCMSEIEDDEHAENFITRHSTFADLSQQTLWIQRLQYLKKWKECDVLRQEKMCLTLLQLLDTDNWLLGDAKSDLEAAFHTNTSMLNILHSFCNQTPEPTHPVSGNGEVDIWVHNRLILGFHRAKYLSILGDIDGAFTVLEDCVSLLEKVMTIDSEVMIGCASPWMHGVKARMRKEWFTAHYVYGKAEELMVSSLIKFKFSSGSWCPILPSDFLGALTNGQEGWQKGIPSSVTRYGWECFDHVRSDPRYQSYVDRVKALVITREAQSQ